jgi:RNA polymerase primary sigma factor
MKQLKINKTIILNKDTKSIKKYLEEVSKIQRLTPDQETSLSIKIKDGDQKALNDLVTANLRFVLSVAKQYNDKDTNLEDLINEGNIGLIEAAKRFDRTTGFKFISYAVWWVRQMMINYKINSRFIRIPANKMADLRKLKEVINKLELELQHNPSLQDIHQALPEHSELTLIELMNLNINSVNSLDKPIKEEFTLSETISDDERYLEDFFKREHQKEVLGRLLNNLSKQQKLILTYYFGLDGNEPMDTKEIANVMGVTSSSILGIKNKAFRILRMVMWRRKLNSRTLFR